MNDELEKVLQELKDKLDNNETIQEYLSLKSSLENNKELKDMRSEIARLTNENKLEEKEALINVYNSHPLVVNYNQIREEVISLLSQIKDILSD